jgi:hypothetical protein
MVNRGGSGATPSGGGPTGGVASGGGPTGGVSSGGRPAGGASSGGSSGCGAGVVPAGSSLVNTTWTMTLNCTPSCCLGQFTFNANGTVTSTCGYSGALYWTQSGSTVIFSVNNCFATYTGTISGTTIAGAAVNQSGTTWPFSMTHS